MVAAIIIAGMVMIGIAATINVHLREMTTLKDRITVTDRGVSENANESAMHPDVIHVIATARENLRHNHVTKIRSDVPTIRRYRLAWTNIAIRFATMSARIFGMASLGPTEMINIHRNDHFQNENETQTMKTTNGEAKKRRRKRHLKKVPKRRNRISV